MVKLACKVRGYDGIELITDPCVRKECRKERVMDIDYPIGISVYHLLGNDLHVARQHYESYLMLCQ